MRKIFRSSSKRISYKGQCAPPFPTQAASAPRMRRVALPHHVVVDRRVRRLRKCRPAGDSRSFPENGVSFHSSGMPCGSAISPCKRPWAPSVFLFLCRPWAPGPPLFFVFVFPLPPAPSRHRQQTSHPRAHRACLGHENLRQDEPR